MPCEQVRSDCYSRRFSASLSHPVPGLIRYSPQHRNIPAPRRKVFRPWPNVLRTGGSAARDIFDAHASEQRCVWRAEPCFGAYRLASRSHAVSNRQRCSFSKHAPQTASTSPSSRVASTGTERLHAATGSARVGSRGSGENCLSKNGQCACTYLYRLLPACSGREACRDGATTRRTQRFRHSCSRVLDARGRRWSPAAYPVTDGCCRCPVAFPSQR